MLHVLVYRIKAGVLPQIPGNVLICPGWPPGHHNFAGFLILGLGCEDNQVKALTEGL